MSIPQDQNPADIERADRKSWTVTYRVPIAIISGLVTVAAIAGLSRHGAVVWLGAIGLAAVIIWVFVYAWLYRKGY